MNRISPCLPVRLLRLHVAACICFVFLLGETKAQTACFTMEDLGGQPISAGCIPNMVIQFLDCSQGVTYSSVDNGGAYNSHFWEFRDTTGGTSNAQSPVFGYFASGTYIISLTVRASASGPTSTFNDTIVVYEQPVVNMVATPSEGCQPLNVCFTNTSTSSTSPITSCFWDFGGGDYDVNCSPCRTYNMRGTQNCFSVTLLVRNQLGCEAARTFPNAVCVDPPPTANFTSNVRELCAPPFTVTFDGSASQSVNPPLDFKWYFGDGDSATGPTPTHTYDSVGSYDVTLIATDTICNITRTITRPAYIIAREVTAGFANTKTVFCQGECNQFLDTSKINPPGTASYVWRIGSQTYTSQNPNVCPAPGTYNVTLTVSSGVCSDDEIKTNVFTVNPKPDALFTAPNATSCQAPFTVQFNVTNPCATCTYTWLFRPGHPGTGLNPSHTYDTSGVFNVTLEVTDTITGCTATQTLASAVRIENRIFDFEMDKDKGCVPDTVQFTDISRVPPGSTDTVVAWVWDFGDNSGRSLLKNPSYTYPQAGKYVITMEVVTVSGCTGTVTDTVYVGKPLIPDFDINPNPVCVNEPVFFTNLTDTTGVYIPPGDSIMWRWDLPGPSSEHTPPQKIYEEPDTLFVKLAAGILGCFDTIEKQFIVLVPKAEFLYDQDCSDPATVVFKDTSKGADSWFWDFGDGTTSTDTNPTHTYVGCDTFEVLLVVENFLTGCIDSFTQDVRACALNADFDVDSTEACIGEALNFTNRSVGLLPPNGGGYRWDFNGQGSSTQEEPSYAFPTHGLKTVKLVIGPDAVGCYDSLVRPALINVTGAQAAFDATPLTGCIPPTGGGNTVTFTNTSSFLGSPIENLRYQWNFGDGNTSTLQNPTHTYTAAGGYTVSLTVTADNTGCTGTQTRTNYISMRQPNACFTTAGTVFCSGQATNVTNCTQGGGTFTWNWGDNSPPEVGVAPSHVYTLAPNVFRDTFTITMVVVDANGCTDAADPVTVIITQPNLRFLPDNDSSYCPPHVACFTDSSSLDTIPVTSVLWDFGDGDFSTLHRPCHIYTRPGQYNVTLTVQFQNQCISSMTENTLIKVGGATGNIAIAPEDSGCVDLPIVLDANAQGAASLFWYFPDEDYGRLGATGTDTVHHTVTRPGTYQYFVYITDTQTPYPCTYILYADTIVAADSLTAGFTTASGPVCLADPIQFIDTSFTELGDSIVEWFWDFGGGATDTVQNPQHAFTTRGNHLVTLTVTSKMGCTATVSNNVYVLDKPTASFTVSDAQGCDVLFVIFTSTSTAGVDAQLDKYYYNFGDTTSSIDTAIIPIANYNYLRPGAYSPYLVVTDLNGCDDTAIVPINVYKTPDGILLPGTVQICEGDSIQLMTDTFTYDSYSWSPQTFLSDPFAQHPYAFPRVTTTYTVSITEGHGCDMTDTVRVRVLPLPPLTVTPHPSVSICLGDSVQLTAAGALSYNWKPATFIKPSRTVPNPVVFPPVTLDYVVEGLGASGCIAKDTVRVIVSNPQAQFISERNCLGDSTNYINRSQGTFNPPVNIPIVSHHWTFGNTGDTSEDINPTYTFAVADTHLVQLVVIDSSGCTDTVVGNTIIDFPPDAEAEQDTFICLGDSVTLFASGGSTFVWTPGPRIINPTSANPTVFPLENTLYIVNVRNGVCPSDTAQVQVDVITPPVVDIKVPDSFVPRGQTIELTTVVDKTVTVEWTPDDSLSCSDCISPIARPYIKTTYVITVTDEFGCTDSDTVVIDAEVQCRDEQVFVPNAFTPDGNGLNDKLILRMTGIEKINFYRVFDRWGKEVFETKDMNEGWDGKNKEGGQLSGGVYVYVVEAVCFYGRTIVKTGNVTLIK